MTPHTIGQHQAGALTPEQYTFLTSAIAPGRIQHLSGQSHLEQWDIRRHLIRVFGFGGYDIDTLALDLVREIEDVPADGRGRSRWTVVYRAQIRLTVKAADGRVIAHYDDAATGGAHNQPSLSDAHDMAMKTALSQALKRTAVNLGDQFGLSLYNGGRPDPVILRSLVAPTQDRAEIPADEQVQAEPAPAPQMPAEVVSEIAHQVTTGDMLTEAQRRAQRQARIEVARDVETVERLREKARQSGALDTALYDDGTTVRQALDARLAELAHCAADDQIEVPLLNGADGDGDPEFPRDAPRPDDWDAEAGAETPVSREPDDADSCQDSKERRGVLAALRERGNVDEMVWAAYKLRVDQVSTNRLLRLSARPAGQR